jgi:hypothetical protein
VGPRRPGPGSKVKVTEATGLRTGRDPDPVASGPRADAKGQGGPQGRCVWRDMSEVRRPRLERERGTRGSLDVGMP